MRDPKAVMLGVLVALAGIGCGLKANALSRDREAFNTAYRLRYNDFKADAKGNFLTPTRDEDSKYLSEMIERGGVANQWWMICYVLSGVGIALAAYGAIGSAKKKTSAALSRTDG